MMSAARKTAPLRSSIALLVFLSIPPGASAQSPTSVFTALTGDWTGEGMLFDRPARFTMQWRADAGFAHLVFTNGYLDPSDDVTPVLRAAAVYRTDPARPEGVWLDSRGARLELAWETSDSTLVVTWRAPTETGRTTYRVETSGEVRVVDEVRSEGAWRTFATAVFRRRLS